MFKEIIKRAVLGFGFGIIFLNLIFILKSAMWGNGSFIVASNYLIAICHNELNAFLLQFVLTGIMGTLFGASTLLFDIDKLNLLQATIIHFFLITPIGTIIAWISNWMPQNKMGLITWIIQFIVIYVVVWLIIYLSYKRKTKQINDQLALNQK